MRSIFRRLGEKKQRRFLVSLLLPPAFVGATGLLLALLTVFTVAIDLLTKRQARIFGRELSLDFSPRLLIQLAGFLALVVAFTAFYKIMPEVKIRLRWAVIGGTVAATLWMVVRGLMAWYFDNLSAVNAVYGSLATLVVMLMSMEVGAAILLLGAQVIAELEKSRSAGLAWHQTPRADPVQE